MSTSSVPSSPDANDDEVYSNVSESADLFGNDLENWDSFDFSDQDLDNDDIQDIVDQENNDFQDLDDNHHGEEYQSMGLTSGRLPGEILDDLDVKGGADGDISMIDNKMMDISQLRLEQLYYKDLPILELVSMEAPAKAIMREFKDFLLTYTDDNGANIYGERIKTMCENNCESLNVSFVHLSESKVVLAYFLANAPLQILRLFDDVALSVTLINFPNYRLIRDIIHVRITDLPTINTLRDLRKSQLGCLIRVSGIVTKRTQVYPQLFLVKFNCAKCGDLLGPFMQSTDVETVYRNFQKLTLQESPGTIPTGRLPRHLEVILLWDLMDVAKPGEEINVTGIYRINYDSILNIRNGFPVFATIIEANHILKQDLVNSNQLSDDDERQIRDLAGDNQIVQRIVRSIAPSIHGHKNIKRALALALFGGVPKNPGGKHKLRGDINVLIIGDPATAKSHFLKYIEKTASRSVYTTGRGTSAVGLTASVLKDPVTRGLLLQGGALVLADKGVCIIDEFDNMKEADRVSIHEAMEQQSISISKAGIVTTLQARCSIVAAANPVYGRYNPALTFSDNVNLTEPILSRFDIICIVRDIVDPVDDERLARFIVASHVRSHPCYDPALSMGDLDTELEHDKDVIPQDLLKKYITYARNRVHPKLQQVDVEKLVGLYSELRSEILASFPVTVRLLESMIRIAEASARMHLREYVQSDDVDLAIKVALDCFISAQKNSVINVLRRRFSKYITLADDYFDLLYHTLNTIVKENVLLYQLNFQAMPSSIEVTLDDFNRRVRKLNIYDISRFLKSSIFLRNGFRVNDMVIVKTFSNSPILQ